MSNTPEGKQYLYGTTLTFKILTLAAVTSVFLLVTVGVTVRVTESGLGCPDWPLCHGQIIPPFEYHAILEYSHRLVASLVGLLVALSALWSWLFYRDRNLIVRPLFSAAILVVVAALLGRAAVLSELSPNIVTLHLAIAETVFALLIISTASAWSENLGDTTVENERDRKKLLLLSQISAISVSIIVLSGSYDVNQGATAVCTSWPLCGGVSGGIIPGNGLEWTHMIHRFLSAGGVLIVAWLVFQIWTNTRFSGMLAQIGSFVLLILILQILVGASHLWFNFPVIVRIVHLSLATALWGGLVLLVTLLWVNKSKSHQASV